jgi:hypothetical protein
MDEQSGVSVKELLPAKIDGMVDTVKQEACKDPDAGTARLAWSFIGFEATKAMRSALDCDVFELLAQAWCTARELHEFSDRSKHPPEEISVLHLGDHKLKTNVEVVLDIAVGVISLPRLRFTVELAAHFRSAALSIRDGHITALASGDCSVSAQLKYRDTELHKPMESRKVTLPGRLPFRAPGLAIG